MSLKPLFLFLLVLCTCAPQSDPPQTSQPTSSKLVHWHRDILKGDEIEFRTLVSQGDTVSFDSRGGYVLSAMAFARHLRAMGASAVVPANARCNSACGLALMGARTLSIAPSARIGVHRFDPVRPGSKQALSLFVTDFGTPASYADTIWEIPHDQTRNLTSAERRIFYPRLSSP